MYDMYPNYAETPKERGEGGLGHYDNPVYEKPSQVVPETNTVPVMPTPEAERALGYLGVYEMVTE